MHDKMKNLLGLSFFVVITLHFVPYILLFPFIISAVYLILMARCDRRAKIKHKYASLLAVVYITYFLIIAINGVMYFSPIGTFFVYTIIFVLSLLTLWQ